MNIENLKYFSKASQEFFAKQSDTYYTIQNPNFDFIEKGLYNSRNNIQQSSGLTSEDYDRAIRSIIRIKSIKRKRYNDKEGNWLIISKTNGDPLYKIPEIKSQMKKFVNGEEVKIDNNIYRIEVTFGDGDDDFREGSINQIYEYFNKLNNSYVDRDTRVTSHSIYRKNGNSWDKTDIQFAK